MTWITVGQVLSFCILTPIFLSPLLIFQTTRNVYFVNSIQFFLPTFTVGTYPSIPLTSMPPRAFKRNQPATGMATIVLRP